MKSPRRNLERALSGKRCLIMGILNVTPDSFSDGGRFFDSKKAVARGLEMARDGADIIDVGGESTRPGARDISAEEELRRVIPVIDALSGRLDVPISVDTRKVVVAAEALRRGATLVNDVSGLKNSPEIAALAAAHGAFLIVMHMKGEPANMQKHPRYKNAVNEVVGYLKKAIAAAQEYGMPKGRIIVDPGIGFGKTTAHNLKILNRLGEFKKLGCPVCVGVSRKSFIGKILGIENPALRLAGTLGACAVAIARGADIIRVHDIRPAREAAAVAGSIIREGN